MTQPLFSSRRQWLMPVLLLVGVIAGGAGWISTAKIPPNPEPARAPPTPEEIARPHLRRAEREAERAVEEHVRQLDAFFADAKKGTPAFAEEALGWGSKWRLAADYVPFTAGDRHPKFLRAKFEDHLFRPDELKEEVNKVIRGYLTEVRGIENQMLVDLRADVVVFPVVYPVAQLDDQRFQELYGQLLARTATAAGHQLQADVAAALTERIARQVLARVAVRLGVSAGTLGAGAASGWATLGAGAVVGLVVDQLVTWVWDWLADPKGSLAADLDQKLDEINCLVVDGTPGAPGLRERLRQLSRDRAAARTAAVLGLLRSPTGGGR